MSLPSPFSSPSNSTSPSFPSQQLSRRSSTSWSTQSSPSLGSGLHCIDDKGTASYPFDPLFNHRPTVTAHLSEATLLPLTFDYVGASQEDVWACSRLHPDSRAPSQTNAGISPQKTNSMYNPSAPAPQAASKSTSPPTSSSPSASPSTGSPGAQGDAPYAVSQPSHDHSAGESPFGGAASSGVQIYDGPIPPPIYHLEPKFPPHPAYVTALELKGPPPVITEKLKGPWQKSEDEALVFWAVRLGTARWVDVAARVGSRTGKQCRERWTNQLSPEIDHSPFRPEEDALIIRMQAAMDGNRWREVAKFLPGRPENTIKNRFNSTVVQRKRADLQLQGPPPIVTPMLLSQKRARVEEQGEMSMNPPTTTKKTRKSGIPLSILPPEQPCPAVGSASDRSSVPTFPSTPITPAFGQSQPTPLAASWSSTSWEGSAHPLHNFPSTAYDYHHVPTYQPAYRYGTHVISPATRGYYPGHYSMTGGGTGGYLTPAVHYSTASDYAATDTMDPQAAYGDYSHHYPSLTDTKSSSGNSAYQVGGANGYNTRPTTLDGLVNRSSIASLTSQPVHSSLHHDAYRHDVATDHHGSRHGSRVASPVTRWAPLATASASTSASATSTSTASQAGSTAPLIGLGITTTGSMSSHLTSRAQDREDDGYDH